MRKVVFLALTAGSVFGLFLFLSGRNDINIASNLTSLTSEVQEPAIPKTNDIEPQKSLANPPRIIKALYVTSWSAGNEKKLNYFINLSKTTEINALVVDVKDFSGYINYNTELELPYKYDAVEVRIPKLNKLVKRLHDEGIYAIARITVFQDPRLALARPDLALFSSSTGKTWEDHKGLTWMDPAAREVWDYNLDIAEEVLRRGFDEVNFDYIRFASDGNLDDIRHPFWDETTLKTRVMRNFFQYMRQRLPDSKISADLFGLVTVNTDGLGIGQHLEYALPYFDAVAPMVYPSHYMKNFIGFPNPAEYPYEVVKYSLDTAYRRIKAYEAAKIAERNSLIKANRLAELDGRPTTTVPEVKVAKMRPWLQDFDLGADYDAVKILGQIRATYEAAMESGKSDLMNGWMLWNASNVYTKEALQDANLQM